MLEHRTKWKWTCKCINFERDVQEFKILDEPNLESVVDNLSDSMQALEINVSEVLYNSIKTVEAKTKRTCLMNTRKLLQRSSKWMSKNHFHTLGHFTKSHWQHNVYKGLPCCKKIERKGRPNHQMNMSMRECICVLLSSSQ